MRPQRGDETAQRADGTSWLVRHRRRSMVLLSIFLTDNLLAAMLLTGFDRVDRQIDWGMSQMPSLS
jgi:hypothetical protein